MTRSAESIHPASNALAAAIPPRYHRAMKLRRLALLAACLPVLAACGNKGPLVLPQKPAPVEAPVAPAEPAGAPVGSPGDGGRHAPR